MQKKELDYLHSQGWIVDRSGQKFIKYAGLLWLAHQKGLFHLTSEPVFEDPENGGYCFRAVAKGFRMFNQQVIEVTFEDQGDAFPYNTGKMIKPHIRRMASTRAKARVLRDYCGVGFTSLEEII
tara:strand:- start:4264 stop:4635 length:372 start_codon:yes stop_codon:yes gene_type:complete